MFNWSILSGVVCGGECLIAVKTFSRICRMAQGGNYLIEIKESRFVQFRDVRFTWRIGFVFFVFFFSFFSFLFLLPFCFFPRCDSNRMRD